MSSFLSGIFHFGVSMLTGCTGDTTIISRVGKTACCVARSRVAMMMMCVCLGSGQSSCA
jgi:hypothetical protein